MFVNRENSFLPILFLIFIYPLYDASMKRLVFILCIFLAAFIQPSFADTNCPPNGCTTTPSRITLQTTVVNPVTGISVHTLGPTDPLFGPNDSITLGITIANAGTTTIPNTTIVDALPQYVRYVSSGGTFDKVADTVTFTSGPLAPNQSQNFTIQGMLVSDLPGIQPNCVVNAVTATTSDDRTEQSSTNFCVTPGVSPTAQTLTPPPMQETPATTSPITPQLPATGSFFFILLLAVPISIGGYFIRKAAKKKDT